MSDAYGGTISAFEFFERFPNEQAAVEAIEARRWKDCVVCPYCESERTTSLSGGYYHQCNNKECRKQFTVRTGTIFERSHIPLHKWLYAMCLLQTARKGISSMQLSKELGVTQKSAWFLLHRLREALDIEAVRLDGEVEIDETYVNEFVSRLNEGNVRNHTMVRLGHIIDNAVGKRLTYEELTR